LFAMKIAKKSNRLVRQNFALALLYNMIAVPMAFSGIVTPLIAAIAMSASSIIVILNSMRLARFGQKPSAPIKATKAIEALA
jgi:Cu2+-exporting ATPase